ncbi:MAG: ATP-binding cassette domain-containing protein [Chloroflexota bacterium]|nr:ATP-binding cassette domain-containing protein [Chloroflexota bacterium]
MSKYYGEYPAVIDVSFNISKGESIGLLGPNGAGKSTTMKVMTGFTPPTSGNVNIGGHDIIKNSIDARKLIGYLPESVPLYTDMTVRDYLKYMGSLRGMNKNISKRVDEVISLTSLNQYKNVLISKLSKGYRQRTGIAQAILHKPKILILDEPTIGIDPVQVVETRKLIQNLGEDHTLILSSHILPEVTSICKRVLVIHEGKIVADDTPENLSNRLQTSNLCEIKVKNGKSNGIIKLLRNEEYIVDIRTKDDNNDEFENYYIETSSVKSPESLISKILINNNIELFGLSSLPLTLEEIFLQLTKD